MKKKKNKTKWRPTKLDIIKFSVSLVLIILLFVFWEEVMDWCGWVITSFIDFVYDCIEGKYSFEQVARYVVFYGALIAIAIFGLYMIFRKHIIDLISEDTQPWNNYKDGKLHNEFPTRKQEMQLYDYTDINNYHAPGIIVDYEEVTTITILGIKIKK